MLYVAATAMAIAGATVIVVTVGIGIVIVSIIGAVWYRSGLNNMTVSKVYGGTVVVGVVGCCGFLLPLSSPSLPSLFYALLLLLLSSPLLPYGAGAAWVV